MLLRRLSLLLRAVGTAAHATDLAKWSLRWLTVEIEERGVDVYSVWLQLNKLISIAFAKNTEYITVTHIHTFQYISIVRGP